jgi:pimeloyl-ACP methyl ester carboxylesterase
VGRSPQSPGHLHRLASFSRLILTDLLGTGSSDAVPINDRPAMQSWTDGLVAVLDAVGSERVSVLGMAESTLPVMLLAATHPHRVSSLVRSGCPSWLLRDTSTVRARGGNRPDRRRVGAELVG